MNWALLSPTMSGRQPFTIANRIIGDNIKQCIRQLIMNRNLKKLDSYLLLHCSLRYISMCIKLQGLL